MVVITHIVNKRPITENIETRYYMRRKGEVDGYGSPVEEDYIDSDYEHVERYPAGSPLFKVIETSGSSAMKTRRYFMYLGDLLKYLSRYVSAKPMKYSYIPYRKGQELGLILTNLREGKYKKVIFNRNVTWEVSK